MAVVSNAIVPILGEAIHGNQSGDRSSLRKSIK